MLGEILSAYEFLDSECLNLLKTHLKLQNPVSGARSHAHVWDYYYIHAIIKPFFCFVDCPFYIVIETQGSDPNHDEEKLHNFLEEAMASSLVVDGTVATEEGKIKVPGSKLNSLIASKLSKDFFFFLCHHIVNKRHSFEIKIS